MLLAGIEIGSMLMGGYASESLSFSENGIIFVLD
jgi:hypothetical protein